VQSGEEDVPTVAGGGHKSRSDARMLLELVIMLREAPWKIIYRW
jgi:hypothetical protein